MGIIFFFVIMHIFTAGWAMKVREDVGLTLKGLGETQIEISRTYKYLTYLLLEAKT